MLKFQLYPFANFTISPFFTIQLLFRTAANGLVIIGGCVLHLYTKTQLAGTTTSVIKTKPLINFIQIFRFQVQFHFEVRVQAEYKQYAKITT